MQTNSHFDKSCNFRHLWHTSNFVHFIIGFNEFKRGGRLTLTEYFRDKFSRVTLTKMVAMATSK